MITSLISKVHIPEGEAVNLADVRPGIFAMIKSEFPDINESGFISLTELNKYRRLFLTKLMEDENESLSAMNQDVFEAIKNNELLSYNPKTQEEETDSLGARIADKVASFGGSWKFIIIFFTFLIAWMCLNFLFLKQKAFDPYPFILLNLILSCVAAIQAPIILMSQNRQEVKDRKRAEQDFKINLKAELEIKLLSDKVDHLLIHQNIQLLEIQKVQLDYLEDLAKEKQRSKH